MSDFKVVVTDDRYGAYDEERAVLSPIGAELLVCDFQNESEARDVLADADGILLNLFPMTSSLIADLKRCRVISRYGVGYDNVDLKAATAANIAVGRVPDYCLDEVSDHTVALFLDLARGISRRDRAVRRGEWNLSGRSVVSRRIRGGVLGIVGYGAVGRAVREKMAVFGFSQILAYDPYVSKDVMKNDGVEVCSLEDLLGQSDVVTVHAPLNNETRGLIGFEELSSMKLDSLLINTSRGPLVDESALVDHLGGTPLAGAALDVYQSEPLPPSSGLRFREDVVLSDHAGWYSEQSIAELKTKAAGNVAAVLQGKPPIYPVPL